MVAMSKYVQSTEVDAYVQKPNTQRNRDLFPYAWDTCYEPIFLPRTATIGLGSRSQNSIGA